MGQDMFVNTDEYFTQDGNIDTSVAPTGLRLVQSSGSYVATGSLESSTFDTGGVSTFTTISWEPTSQNPQTELKFQVASNTDNLTWNYIGPDGTAATYYTVPGTNLHASHDGHQYIRYKAFLSTNDSSQTPVLTSVGINYVSGCFTPGQAVFPNVSGGSGYDLDISLSGYQSYSETNFTINGNLVTEVLLTPQ